MTQTTRLFQDFQFLAYMIQGQVFTSFPLKRYPRLLNIPNVPGDLWVNYLGAASRVGHCHRSCDIVTGIAVYPGRQTQIYTFRWCTVE